MAERSFQRCLKKIVLEHEKASQKNPDTPKRGGADPRDTLTPAHFFPCPRDPIQTAMEKTRTPSPFDPAPRKPPLGSDRPDDEPLFSHRTSLLSSLRPQLLAASLGPSPPICRGEPGSVRKVGCIGPLAPIARRGKFRLRWKVVNYLQ